MGSVWVAQDTLLGRKVAIKLLSDPYLHDPAAVLRFAREARAAAQLSSHTNVVTTFDVGEAGGTSEDPQGRPFIVMEYLEGGTVADAIRAGEVNQARALEWIAQAASAIDFAHSHGVVHRDIKPSNMLLDVQRVLHVGDFGIARVASEDTITTVGHVFGTAAYLSPEQAVGSGATAASDRYSLAVVAYELLAGSRPFAGEHFAAQARQHADDQPAPASSHNPRLTPALDEVLARGLAKSPQTRWSSCGDFAQALERSLRRLPPIRKTSPRLPPTVPLERPTAASRRPLEPPFTPARRPLEPPLTPPRRPLTPPRRRRPRAAALAALVAGVIAVTAAVAAVVGGSTTSGSKLASRPPTHTSPAAAQLSIAAPKRAHASTPTATGTTTSSTTSATRPPAIATSLPAAGATTPVGTSADSLQAQGHSLMLGGQYGAAVPILRQAVRNANPSSLTYAYALYDLGHSLRLSGAPQAAVGVLQQRLQIPNQTGVVRHELDLALQQSRAGGGGGGR